MIYYIILIVLGQFIMLNLFLAILLGNFDEARAKLLEEMLQKQEEAALNAEKDDEDEDEDDLGIEIPKRKFKNPLMEFQKEIKKEIFELLNNNPKRLQNSFCDNKDIIKTEIKFEDTNLKSVNEVEGNNGEINIENAIKLNTLPFDPSANYDLFEEYLNKC